MKSSTLRQLTPVAAFYVLVLATPTLLSHDYYYLSILNMAGIIAIIVMGLNLLLGFAGQISLGHAALFGISAYTTAVMTATYGLPLAVGMISGVGLTAVVALVVGMPVLKLKGYYLAMATLGFGLIVYIFFNEAISLTGGPSGFVGIPQFQVGSFVFDSDLSYFFLVWTTVTVVLLISLNLIHSRIGRALMALHASDKAAQSMGINVARYKLFIFVLSAVFAGIAGVLYAHYLSFVAPSSFGFHFSVQLITMVVLGGMASLWGGIAGTVFLTAMPEFLRAYENMEVIIYGLILILCMMYLPQGMAGGVSKLIALIRGRFGHVR
ncbi:branched-chain amino acid ABC transporter permease [Desulfonatronum sp. SC1]|uniref:branched-chain amino acid ABC transporter permease n=1 Tax=Desulfonatronum sp. SC1 TaxID=2109626 RepID=UPI000D3069E3|nr:branched-chain amino acid ABC transporter permease [Desulfonatronum sp. SC1]PTN34375.1 branched-chain amino acid ABC transporter permease [Desulfonatronum sp. SC1]